MHYFDLQTSAIWWLLSTHKVIEQKDDQKLCWLLMDGLNYCDTYSDRNKSSDPLAWLLIKSDLPAPTLAVVRFHLQ